MNRILYPLLVFLAGSASLFAQVKIIRDTFCSDQLIVINGNVYGPNRPTGTEVIPGAAANGGDSIIEVHLVFLKPSITRIEGNRCEGDTVWVNGVPYHAGFYVGEEIIEKGAANGCDSMILLEIRFFFRDSWMTLGEDREVYYGEEVCLNPLFSFSPTALRWSPAIPCATLSCLPFCRPYTANARYILEARDPYGCWLRDTVNIRVLRQAPMYAPNVFAPGSAWPNNYFFLSASAGVQQINRMLIANRWGELLYEREAFSPNVPELGWDGNFRGQAAPPDVYLFWAEVLLWDNSIEEISGTVTLIR